MLNDLHKKVSQVNISMSFVRHKPFKTSCVTFFILYAGLLLDINQLITSI